MDRAAARQRERGGLFLIPLISMRLFAEEKRTGTIELLMTSPPSDWKSFLANGWERWRCMGRCWYCCSPTLRFCFSGRPDWSPVRFGFSGLILEGASTFDLYLHFAI